MIGRVKSVLVVLLFLVSLSLVFGTVFAAPYFYSNTTSVATGTQYASGRNYGFQVNVTQIAAGGVAVWNVTNVTFTFGGVEYRNDTYNSTVSTSCIGSTCYPYGTALNFTLLNTTTGIYWLNFTDQPGGTYSFLWSANSTENSGATRVYVGNATTAQTYTIAQNTSANAVMLVNNSAPPANLTLTYPLSFNVTAFTNVTIPPSFTLYVLNTATNATSTSVNTTTTPQTQATLTNLLLGNGTYWIVFNTTGNANYTSLPNNMTTVIVQKGVLNLNLPANQTIVYPNAFTVNGTTSHVGDADVIYQLFRGGTVVSNITAGSPNETVILSNGTYTYTLNTTAGAFGNWTANATTGNTTNVLVLKGNQEIILYANGTATSTVVVEKGTALNITAASNATINNITLAMQIFTNFTGTNSSIVNTSVSLSTLYNLTDTSKLSLGNYTISAYANTTTNYTSISNNTIIVQIRDTTAPSVTFTLSRTAFIYVGTTLSSADFSCTATDNDVVSSTTITGFDTSSTGDKTSTCVVTDASSNSATKTTTYTVRASTSSSPGGTSGGSTSATSTETGKAVAYVPSIAANSAATITINKATATNINEIKLSVSSAVSSIYVTVNKLADKPADVAIAPTGTTMSYMSIITDVANANVKNSTIKFEVSKSWIANNNIDQDKVYLNRYTNNQWYRLATVKLSEDSANVYYQATTPGFSYFAITGETQTAAPTTPPTTPPTAPPATTPTTPTTPGTTAAIPINMNIVYLAVAIVIIVVALGVWRYSVMKKLKSRR